MLKNMLYFTLLKSISMTHYLKPGLSPVVFLLLSLSAQTQAPAFNQNSSRSNNAKMQGFDFRVTPQYAVDLNGSSIDSLFFRGNGAGFNVNAGYTFGDFGIGLSSGFISSQTDKTEINKFISRSGVPADQLIISTANQQNMYLLLGPYAEFGSRVKTTIHAEGGMFINNPGLVNIQRRGTTTSVYRNEPSSKNLYPGFMTGINLNYPLSSQMSIGFSADYMHTKGEVVNYDIRKSGGAVGTEGIKLSKNISSLLAGITFKYDIKSPRDIASGQSSGKQIGKPKYEDIQARDVSTGQSSGKTYQPGKPQYGNKTINESCGPVTVTKTNTDGSTEEMTFACPDDAATYNQRTADYSERATWTTSNPNKTYAVPHVLEQKGTISGKVSWTSSNSGIGIVSNKTIRGGSMNLNSQTSSTRTTPATSFGTMVRMSAREAGSGMATGRRQYEPVFDEGQGEVCNPCLVTVGNPIYKGMGNAQSNPMYDNKTRIAEPGDCDDAGISDLKISLVNISSGQVVATTRTEKCGDFFFANVPDGDYTIQLSGMISSKKGYDIYLKSKAEVEGQLVWGGESVNLVLFESEEVSNPAMRAGISTSRSNIRTKSITIIDADTDGDGVFETFKVMGSFSDGSTSDITEDAAASRVNKIDAITIKQKALQPKKSFAAKLGNVAKGAVITGVTVASGDINGDGIANERKITATYADGSVWDITADAQIISSGDNLRQYTITVADLDDDGLADAVVKITKSRSNIQNNRMMTGTGDDNGNTIEGVKITKSRSNIQNNRIIKGNDEDDQELGVVKTKTKSNQSNDRVMSGDDDGIWSPRSNRTTYVISVADLDGDGKAESAINNSHSNIKNLSVIFDDVDGDGVPEATINNSHSNIKNLRVATGDVNGDGMADMLVGGMLPGGAVISSALRSPGDPIPGLDVKISKKSGGNEKIITPDESGRIKIIGPDMEPDTYELKVSTNIYIEDETRVIVRGWDMDKKEMDTDEQGNSNTKAQDHNSSRSNKTASAIDTDPDNGSIKWTAPQTMKATVNTSRSNIKHMVATLDELDQMLSTDNINAKSIVNTSRSNIKSQRAAITSLEETLNTMETMDRNKAMTEIKSKMVAVNMQFLALQESLGAAGKQYTSISNVLKTKHDTVKNSIGNIR
jgi:hypothetical protein